MSIRNCSLETFALKKKSETSEEKKVPKITRENVTGNAEVLKKPFMISH